MTDYFPKPINSTDEFFEKLEREGKVKYLDKPKHYEAMEKMNEGMVETMRESKRMQAESWISAGKTYIGINDYLLG